MIQVYFDEELIDKDYYSALSNNFEIFGTSFKLGTTASNKFELSVDKRAVEKHPADVKIYDDGILITTLVVDNMTEDDNFYNYTLTDRMVNLEFYYDASQIFQNGYATLLQIALDICSKAGIELGTTDFRGYNKEISWYNNTRTAREYIGYIAELNGGYAQIGTDGKLYFLKQNIPSAKDINIDECSDFSIGEKYEIKRVVYEQGALKYEFGDESGNTLYLNSDNVFITEESEVEEIYNELTDFIFYNFTTSDCPIDFNIKAGQIVTFIDGQGNKYPTIVGYELTYYGQWNGGYSLDINSEKQEETKVAGTETKIKNLRITVDRANNSIKEIIQEQTNQSQKISQVTQTVDEITQEINDITGENSIKNGDFSDGLENWFKSASGGNASVVTRNNKNYANLLSMYGTTLLSQEISGLFSNIEYTLSFDIFDDVSYDNVSVADNAKFSIAILQDADANSEEIVTVYEEEIQIDETESRKSITFTLDRNSQNVIIDFKLKANGYLSGAVSVMISNIVLSGGNITEKLAKLNMSVDEINSTVSETYETKENANAQYSQIKQTTDDISSEVSKKVGENEVISKINQSAEAVGINANKINLSANDILNLLAGNEVNISGKQIKLTGNNITIDEEGVLTAFSAILNNITVNGGKIKITGGTKNKSNLSIEATDSNANTQITPESTYIDVAGEGGLYINSSNASNSSLAYLYSDNYDPQLYLCGVNTGNMTRVKSSGITTPNLNQTSLENIKKNIVRFDKKALDIIKNSEIYEYNLKTEEDTDKKHIGFVIGEKYNTPEEVIANDGKGIDAYTMRSITWKAMQELLSRVEKLEKGANLNENRNI